MLFPAAKLSSLVILCFATACQQVNSVDIWVNYSDEATVQVLVLVASLFLFFFVVAVPPPRGIVWKCRKHSHTHTRENMPRL